MPSHTCGQNFVFREMVTDHPTKPRCTLILSLPPLLQGPSGPRHRCRDRGPGCSRMGRRRPIQPRPLGFVGMPTIEILVKEACARRIGWHDVVSCEGRCIHSSGPGFGRLLAARSRCRPRA